VRGPIGFGADAGSSFASADLSGAPTPVELEGSVWAFLFGLAGIAL